MKQHRISVYIDKLEITENSWVTVISPEMKDQELKYLNNVRVRA